MQQLNPTGPTMIPPSGTITFNGRHNITIKDYSRDRIINAYIEALAANGYEIVDPAREVDQQLAGIQGYSSPIPVAAITEKPRGPLRLIDKVNQFCAQIYSEVKALKYVSALDANARAAICARCPKNQDWEGSCTTCNQNAKERIRSQIILLSQNRQTPNHDRLSACAVTGHSNRIAVWLDEKNLKRRERFIDDLPKACWLKSL